jgi:hypothetical protein
MESTDGFAQCLQGSIKTKPHSWKSGVDEEAMAGILVIALRGIITHDEVFHLFQRSSACLESMLPLEKAEAHFWLLKLQKEQRALIIRMCDIMSPPGLTDPQTALQIPLRMVTPDQALNVQIKDHPADTTLDL